MLKTAHTVLGILLVIITCVSCENPQYSRENGTESGDDARVTCEDDYDCKNKGICKGEEDKQFCICKSGTSGDTCEIIAACEKGGKYENCKDENGECTFEKGEAVCKCSDEKNLDPSIGKCRMTCEDDYDCKNKGICKGEEDKQFCICKSGTSGDTCEIIAACEKGGKYENCKDENGECTFEKGEAVCKCSDEKNLDPSIGKCRMTCEEDYDCKNEGTCSGGEGNKFCSCKTGTSGDLCETITDCEKGGRYENCKGDSGECTFENGIVVCRCTDGEKKLDLYSGQCREQCTSDSDCENEAKCIGAGSHKFCNCRPGTWGDTCGITDCEEGGKYEDCNGDKGECVFEKGAFVCKCSDDKRLDEDAGYCKSKFCMSYTCRGDSECIFEKDSNSVVCKCKEKNKYYDYSTDTCTEPDKCILKNTPCGEYSECKDGACQCIKNFRMANGTCIPDFCRSNSCFPGAICQNTYDGGMCSCEEGKYFDGRKCADGACFLGDFKTTCTRNCPPDFQRVNNTCEPREGYSSCAEDCGYGYCVQKNGLNYTCSCISSISENLEKRKDGKCILQKNICASKKLTADSTKCSCTGRYKVSSNGITCELKTCSDASAQEECKQKGAQCEMDKLRGYYCRCPRGYLMDNEQQICRDLCSLKNSKIGCLKVDQFCYNSLDTLNSESGDCRCPPVLKQLMSKEEDSHILKCNDMAENVYVIKGIPVLKTRYVMGDTINHVLLNADLINSMKRTFKEFNYGYLLDYQLNGDVLDVSVWIQFNDNPANELNRIPLQTASFECDDCNSDLSLWPPFLLLDKYLLNGVSSELLTFCSEESKNILCGKEAICINNKCSCPRGYKTVEYSIRDTGKFRIERCEDIDECRSGSHICPLNTTCVNLPGDYYCHCKTNFKKANDPVQSRVIMDKSDCYDLCTPNPCNNGTCELNNDKVFNCRCHHGFSGSFCDTVDINLENANRITIIVGVILGAILIVTLIAFFLLYRRKKQNS